MMAAVPVNRKVYLSAVVLKMTRKKSNSQNVSFTAYQKKWTDRYILYTY